MSNTDDTGKDMMQHILELWMQKVKTITPAKAVHMLEDIHDKHIHTLPHADIRALCKIIDWIRWREMERVHFKHDCSECTFLGHYIPPKEHRYDYDECDLYYCLQNTRTIPTIIAICGDEPDNNVSGMPTSKAFYEEHPHYYTHEGYRRAKAKGLLVPELI